jgi:hypothetical protein
VHADRFGGGAEQLSDPPGLTSDAGNAIVPARSTKGDHEMATQIERKYKVREGDTWSSIAARELGNSTLGTELAGWNGQNAESAPPEGGEIRILGAGGEDTGKVDTSADERPAGSPTDATERATEKPAKKTAAKKRGR